MTHLVRHVLVVAMALLTALACETPKRRRPPREAAKVKGLDVLTTAAVEMCAELATTRLGSGPFGSIVILTGRIAIQDASVVPSATNVSEAGGDGNLSLMARIYAVAADKSSVTALDCSQQSGTREVYRGKTGAARVSSKIKGLEDQDGLFMTSVKLSRKDVARARVAAPASENSDGFVQLHRSFSYIIEDEFKKDDAHLFKKFRPKKGKIR